MPPKNFADDGAAGASSSGGTDSGAIGGVTMNDPGPAASPSPPALPTTSATGDMPGQNGKMVGVNTALGGFSNITGDQMATLQSGGGQPLSSIYPGFSFAAGGAIPDDQGGDGSPQQDQMSQALESVDKTMQYIYQKYGLTGGGDQEGNQQQAAAMPTIPGNQSETPGPYVPQQPKPQQMAANSYQNNQMPAIPGTQSNSGVPPLQPQPGPLPPTNNPFGKRADDSSGAIDTDEGTA